MVVDAARVRAGFKYVIVVGKQSLRATSEEECVLQVRISCLRLLLLLLVSQPHRRRRHGRAVPWKVDPALQRELRRLHEGTW